VEDRHRREHHLLLAGQLVRRAGDPRPEVRVAVDDLDDRGHDHRPGDPRRQVAGGEEPQRLDHRAPRADRIVEAEEDGRQERLVTTDDFLTIAEQESGMKLDWLFEVYLRQPKLPRLGTSGVGSGSSGVMQLSWEIPNNMPFPMPIDVEINGKIQRIEMPNGRATVNFTGTPLVIDPKGWVLKQ